MKAAKVAKVQLQSLLNGGSYYCLVSVALCLFLRGAPRNELSLGRGLNRRPGARDHAARIARRFTEREQHTNSKRRGAAYPSRAVNQHGFPRLQLLCYIARKRPETIP